MRPAKVTHNLNSRVVDPGHQGNLIETKTLLSIARSSYLTPTAIRTIIPSNIPLNSPEYIREYTWVTNTVEDCYFDGLNFVGPAVERIITVVDELCGDGFFANLTRKERYAIFTAVFNQFPVWTMAKFKPQENQVVDFGEIFRRAIRRRDLVKKKSGESSFGTVLCFSVRRFSCGSKLMVRSRRMQYGRLGIGLGRGSTFGNWVSEEHLIFQHVAGLDSREGRRR